jgi:acylphosphatase
MFTARRYVIHGRVQGVGFRFFARDAARVDGIRGVVRNLDDGTVEIHAEGDADAVLRFERAIRRGPRSARVDDVQVEPAPPTAGFTDFRIEP